MEESSQNGQKTLGEGETAHNGQFILLPQCF